MKNTLFLLLFCFLITFSACNNKPNENAGDLVSFRQYANLPKLPGNNNQPGLAGVFSGMINNRLIIAGGTNFPDKMPWENGEKKWYGDIYVLSVNDSGSRWQVFPSALPQPLAYGASVTLPEGILFIGGCDQDRSSENVFLLHYDGFHFTFEPWPSLPVPLAYMCCALVDGIIYVAGGEDICHPGATHCFFALDIKNKNKGWESLPAWPGPPRAFAVATGQSNGVDNCFYLFSGRSYGPHESLNVLSDGFEYNPRAQMWKRLDSPAGPSFHVMAGTAVSAGANHIVFIGGSDGELMYKENQIRQKIISFSESPDLTLKNDSTKALNNQLKMLLENHPGFSRNILYYHTITNTVFKQGKSLIPVPVTTMAVRDQNHYYFTCGEIRPGVRTAQVFQFTCEKADRQFGILNSLVIAIYFGILVWMGWFFSGRQKNSNDYFRGGGRLPWWAVGLSIFGTSLSAITFMAIPAKAYATDWSYMLFNAGIILVVPVITSLFIPFFRNINATTAYEYIEHRFNLATRLICSLVFILFQTGRMGIVLFLPAVALNVVTGIDIFICIGLMGVLSLVYTMLGGIEAVIWTDALQVVVLLGGAILSIFLIVVNTEGGIASVVSIGTANGKFHLADTAFDLKSATLWTVLIASVFTNITTYGTDQTMVQRYLTTKNKRKAVQSVWANAVLAVPATLIFFFVGTALFCFYKKNPSLLTSTISDSDAIFPWYIYTQMPDGITGLLVSGIFAAAMSTLSSSMNSAATAYVVDIHCRLGWPGSADQLKLARWVTLIVGTAGILFALMMVTWDIKSLWDEFNKILGLILGGLGGLFLLGILTRRANGIGAMAGMAGSVLFQIWVGHARPVHLLLYTTTGFLSCFVIGYLVSLLFQSNTKEIIQLTLYGLRKNTHDE